MFYQFGEYQLDTEAQKLIKNKMVVSDDFKTIKLLQDLCTSYPEVADKHQLIENIWPDQVVSDWSLSRLISDVRQILEDSGKNQDYIKTIRGRGFRLNVALEELSVAPVAKLIIPAYPDRASGHFFRLSRSLVGRVALFSAFVAASAWGILSYLPFSPQSEGFVTAGQGILRVAVLPVTSENNDPVDEWIKYGIMSLATEQLGQYPSIQTIPVATTISIVTSQQQRLKDDELGSQLFEVICGQLGCTHLVSIKHRLEGNQPALTYQVFDKNGRSAISEFIQSDIVEAADVLLDFLASDLIPGKMQRISLAATYSKD